MNADRRPVAVAKSDRRSQGATCRNLRSSASIWPLENSLIQVFVARDTGTPSLKEKLSRVTPMWPLLIRFRAWLFGFRYWSIGGGMMCSASQDWKLSSDSTISISPLAVI